jgi:uncharacterized protein
VTTDGWNGHDLLAAMRHAASLLHAQLDEVNALNVFPVPDGDTGSNMLATMRAAITEAESVPPEDRTVTRVAAAVSFGALMGARGNSGVILSQLLRGISEGIGDAELVTGSRLASAFVRGCDAAFSAVAHPVEGTILTVARDVADASGKFATSEAPLATVLRVAVEAAAASVVRTPDLLPVLRDAGVVDAGGRGLELLLRGALASITGEHLPQGTKLLDDLALPTWDSIEAEGFGYETVFVVLPPDGGRLDVTQIRTRLGQLGESVLVAGDERAAKIHVHNERPDEVIAYGLTLGSLSNIVIENLDRQATDMRARAKEQFEHPSANGNGPSHDGAAVIAVVPGDGFARVFGSLGADAVVQGGQSDNPSAGELAEAIRGTGVSDVIILANNPNVRMAARQAGDLLPDVSVQVVGTRNAGEGVAALLAFDPDLTPRDAAKLMSDAATHVQTLQVTVAVRDARMGRKRVKRGSYIVLGPSDGLVANDADRTVAIRDAIAVLKPGFELLTVYRGRDVDNTAAQLLRDTIAAELDGVDIELVDGGQAHYDFLIAAE